MTTLALRPYRTHDARATADVYQVAIRVTAAQHYDHDQVEAWAGTEIDLERWNHNRSAARTVIAEQNGIIVGFADLTSEGELDMLFVHPNAGDRGGAHQLVATTLAEARKREFRFIRTRASRAARPASNASVSSSTPRFWRTRSAKWQCPSSDIHVDLCASSGTFHPMPVERARIRVKSMLIAPNQEGTAHAVSVNGVTPENPVGYHRFVGGSVEFGETHRDALIREVREELDADVCDLTYLGCIENIFRLDGALGHEIVFMYSGLLDPMPAAEGATLTEIDGSVLPIVWRSENDPQPMPPLYPKAATDLVRAALANRKS